MLIDELGPLDQRIDHLVLGDDGDIATLHEQVPAPVAGRDTEISLTGLTRAVHHAPHDRHLQRQLALTEGIHGALGDIDHIDLGATTRRTRNEIDVLALAKTERLEQLTARSRLLHRISGERIANRVADALHEQRRDTRRRLHQPRRRRARLGHPEMQRMIGHLRELAIGLHHLF